MWAMEGRRTLCELGRELAPSLPELGLRKYDIMDGKVSREAGLH